ncbi:MAG TPA: DUF4032 domain-containing protein [Marmoricola sp.]|nr:DUF4032 domain-containing protein [Marmoricola sp.]
MALRIVSHRPDPAIYSLPWSLPLEEWQEHVVPLPRGLSRHVVRIVRLGEAVYAVKETTEEMAWREYNLLRNLHRLGLPAVVPHGVVTGRVDASGADLPAALITRHLRFALPYRALFAHGMRTDSLPSLIDALVVLLVRLHIAGFYWGDVSLSNVLFRRDAGALTAYLVDAETGELRNELSAPIREYDVEVGTQNVYAELLDLEAGQFVDNVDPHEVVDLILTRYRDLWNELTGTEVFDTDQMWRIEQRIARLNDLGFDVDELDVITDFDGEVVRITPCVVELGHHSRQFRSLTGLDVEDNQARVLLNDLAAFTAATGMSAEDPMVVANRWLREVYEPIMRLVPPAHRGKLEGPELFHEILVHRWYLSERAGHEVDIFATARDYIDTQLAARPDEAIASITDD